MTPITDALSTGSMFMLVLALALALSFEFVNGFHDTANAVATVIYTNSLRPWIAVIWSGTWNLIGVLTSTGLVAFGILSLLPVELILSTGTGAGFAMVFALLISAIIWNLGTWWLGLPASSSHSLIGSIMGVGLANALMKGLGWSAGVNWAKAQEVFTALLVSPLVGFFAAGALMLILKYVVRNKELLEAPDKSAGETNMGPHTMAATIMLVAGAVLAPVGHYGLVGSSPMGWFTVSGWVQVIGIVLLAFGLITTIDNWVIASAAKKGGGKLPPWWIRIMLVGTCTGVSFAHGSNDGQKGMGLIMLILIGILPGAYALNMGYDQTKMADLYTANQKAQVILDHQAGVAPAVATASTAAITAAAATTPTPAAITAVVPATQAVVTAEVPATPTDSSAILADYLKTTGKYSDQIYPALADENRKMGAVLKVHQDLTQMTVADRRDLRALVYLTSETLAKLKKKEKLPDDADVKKALGGYIGTLNGVVKFIPVWVKFATAFALGLGTMIGWKRIVVTVGEKIGKSHLTYGQGASAEIVAYACIQGADIYGLPVSTTHVLSSGVAGAMAANASGLQMSTLRNLLLAWVLTLPVCMLLGASTFAAGLFIVFHFFSG
jgi:PiT family inorganic phosphate transporter